MSVIEQTPINSYTANGSTTVFNFAFKALAESDIVVTVNDVAISNYTVAGIGSNSGSITFSVAPLSGDIIVIRRMSDLERQSDYQVNGDLLSASFNYDYDKLWLALQELGYQISLAPHLKAGSALAGLIEYDAPVAGEYIHWDAAGTGFDSSPILDSTGNVSLQSALANSTDDGLGDALVYSKVPTGVGRTLHSKLNEFVTVKDFGAVGDGITDDRAAIQTAIEWCSANRVKLLVTSGNYRCNGGLITRSNLHMEATNNAWMIPYDWSSSGSFITNIDSDNDGPDYYGAIQSNVTLINLQIDGTHLPYDLNGNDNAIGFARGMSDLHIHGGFIKGFAYSWITGGAGGKGVNLEQGVSRAIVTGLKIQDCGAGIFCQGVDGSFTSGALKATVGIIFSNIVISNCMSAIIVMGINTDQEPDGDPADQFVLINNITFYNCGHAYDRPVTSSFQKSGAIVIAEGQNAHISNITGHNTAAYTATWPAGGSNVVGAGLTGPIGAVVWGNGRNITINDVSFYGDCDSIVHIGRARAVGEDAGPDGVPSNIYRFDIADLKHYGTAANVISSQSGVNNANISGTSLNIYTDVISAGFVDVTASSYADVYLHLRDNADVSKQVIGSCANIYTHGNLYTAYTSQISYPNQSFLFDAFEQGTFTSIGDDAAVSFTPRSISGILNISSDATKLRCIISYRANATPQCDRLSAVVVGDAIAVTTGVLAGTTGTDGNFTISSHTNGKIYLENRRGGAITIKLTIIG